MLNSLLFKCLKDKMEVACFKWLGRLFQTNGPQYRRLLLRSSVRGLGSDRQLKVAGRATRKLCGLFITD